MTTVSDFQTVLECENPNPKSDGGASKIPYEVSLSGSFRLRLSVSASEKGLSYTVSLKNAVSDGAPIPLELTVVEAVTGISASLRKSKINFDLHLKWKEGDPATGSRLTAYRGSFRLNEACFSHHAFPHPIVIRLARLHPRLVPPVPEKSAAAFSAGQGNSPK